jgi:hypothetical protein
VVSDWFLALVPFAGAYYLGQKPLDYATPRAGGYPPALVESVVSLLTDRLRFCAPLCASFLNASLGILLRNSLILSLYREKQEARPAGFEPTTGGLEIRCSIRLSYGRKYSGAGTMPEPAPEAKRFENPSKHLTSPSPSRSSPSSSSSVG